MGPGVTLGPPLEELVALTPAVPIGSEGVPPVPPEHASRCRQVSDQRSLGVTTPLNVGAARFDHLLWRMAGSGPGTRGIECRWRTYILATLPESGSFPPPAHRAVLPG